MNTTTKTVIFWVVIMISAVLLWQVVKSSSTGAQRTPEISYSEFISQVSSGNVARVAITGTHARGSYRDGSAFEVNLPASQDMMLATLQQKGVEIRYSEASNTPASWLVNLAPLALLAALWFFMLRRIQRGKCSTAQAGPSATSGAPWPQN